VCLPTFSTCTYLHTLTYTHTLTHTYTHSHTHTHMYANTQIHTDTHTHTHTHSQIHTHTHTHTHSHTHTYTHLYANTQIHTVAGEALKVNVTTLGPLVLPISEQAMFIFNLILRKVGGMGVGVGGWTGCVPVAVCITECCFKAGAKIRHSQLSCRFAGSITRSCVCPCECMSLIRKIH